jgi:hypothetical protein
MNIPCNNCLLIPICRNKYYTKLNLECSILHEFLYFKSDSHIRERRPSFIQRAVKLSTTMNPSKWRIMNKSDMVYLYYRTVDEKGAFMIDRNMSYFIPDREHPNSISTPEDSSLFITLKGNSK